LCEVAGFVAYRCNRDVANRIRDCYSGAGDRRPGRVRDRADDIAVHSLCSHIGGEHQEDTHRGYRGETVAATKPESSRHHHWAESYMAGTMKSSQSATGPWSPGRWRR